jgi:ribosome biogenesis GTP-binding protein YsxC/EngB
MLLFNPRIAKQMGVNMILKSVNLETVCGITSVLPKHEKMEIAFAGKSNVGKSSLINALMNRKSYARTSQKPGKTQTINFYNINEAFYFVDLPGYGYAKVNQEIKEKWAKMIEDYLKQSEALRILFLLIDIRHEPSQNDKNMYDWIVHYGFNPIIIATKADKISRGQRNKHISIIRKKLETIEGTPIIPFSALNKEGCEEIWEYIEDSLQYYEEEKNK